MAATTNFDPQRIRFLIALLERLPPEPEPGSLWTTAQGHECEVIGVEEPEDGEKVCVRVKWRKLPAGTSPGKMRELIDLARFYKNTGFGARTGRLYPLEEAHAT